MRRWEKKCNNKRVKERMTRERKEKKETGGCKENVKAMEDGEKSEKGGRMRDRRVKRFRTVGR